MRKQNKIGFCTALFNPFVCLSLLVVLAQDIIKVQKTYIV